MCTTWMDFPEEGRAVVTAIETSPTITPVSAETPAEVGLIKRCSKAIKDRVVERTIQFATLCRHQHAPEPYVHQLINLELPDRIQQADIGITPETCTCTSADVTVKTFGVELETDVLMDLPVDINTSVVDPKAVAVL